MSRINDAITFVDWSRTMLERQQTDNMTHGAETPVGWLGKHAEDVRQTGAREDQNGDGSDTYVVSLNDWSKVALRRRPDGSWQIAEARDYPQYPRWTLVVTEWMDVRDQPGAARWTAATEELLARIMGDQPPRPTPAPAETTEEQ